VIAIAEAVSRATRDVGSPPIHSEGFQSGDWIVLDFLDIMVHIFSPGLREKYQLEQLWRDGKIVDLNINLGSSPSMSYNRI
jgi:ribosome-associated protein